ncbi:MAG TPA: DUF5522 domain-containing protein [Thermoanaerobaculia bacterium]
MSKPLVEGEDFYWEGPYMVFTEKFLRERGYCCESGCRHCPYGFRRDQEARADDKKGGDGKVE